MSFLDDSDDESTTMSSSAYGNPLASATGSRLGSLFGGSGDDQSESDFKFKPNSQQQPSASLQRKLSNSSISSTNSSSNGSTTTSSQNVVQMAVPNKTRGENGSVIHAMVVQLFSFSNEVRQYQPLGSVGAAILNNFPIPSLIFYRNPQDIILQLPITSQHTLFTLQQGQSTFASLHDLHSNRIFSIGFQNANDAILFAKIICIAKFMGQPNMEVSTVNLNELANTLGSTDSSSPICKEGYRVYVKYSGWLVDNDAKKGLVIGKLFDTNENSANLFSFKFGESEVIRGWEQALKGVRVGGRRFCVIPAHLAYGERGVSNVIPPNSILCFQIEVVKMKKMKSSSSAVMPPQNTVMPSPVNMQPPTTVTPTVVANPMVVQQPPPTAIQSEGDLKSRMAKLGAHSYGVVLPQQQQQQPQQIEQQPVTVTTQEVVQVTQQAPVITQETVVNNSGISTTTNTVTTSNVNAIDNSSNTLTPPPSSNVSTVASPVTTAATSNAEIEALKQQLLNLQSLITSQNNNNTPSQQPSIEKNSQVSTPTINTEVKKPANVPTTVTTTSGNTNQWIDDVSVLLTRLDKIEKTIDNMSFTQLIRNAVKFGSDLDGETVDDEEKEEQDAEKEISTHGYQLRKFKKSHIFMSGPLLVENIQHLLATNMKLEADLQKEREQVDSLIEKISQLRKKQEKYAQQQLELTHLSLESNNLSEKGMYEEELQKLNETIANLRKQLAEQKRKTSRAQEQVQSEKETIENLQSEIEVLKKEIEEVNAENKKKKIKLENDHKEKIASLEEEFNEKIQRLENEHNLAIQKLKREQKHEIERIRTEHNENMEKRKVENLEEQTSEEISNLTQSMNKLKEAATAQASKITELNEELESKNQEISDLEEQNTANLKKLREKFLEALDNKADNVRTLFTSIFRTLVNKIYHTFIQGISGKKLSQAATSAFLGKIVKKFSLKAIQLISEEFSGVELLNFDPNIYIDYDPEEENEDEMDEAILRRRSLLTLDLEEEEAEDLQLEEEEPAEEEKPNMEVMAQAIREKVSEEFTKKITELQQALELERQKAHDRNGDDDEGEDEKKEVLESIRKQVEEEWKERFNVLSQELELLKNKAIDISGSSSSSSSSSSSEEAHPIEKEDDADEHLQNSSLETIVEPTAVAAQEEETPQPRTIQSSLEEDEDSALSASTPVVDVADEETPTTDVERSEEQHVTLQDGDNEVATVERSEEPLTNGTTTEDTAREEETANVDDFSITTTRSQQEEENGTSTTLVSTQDVEVIAPTKEAEGDDDLEYVQSNGHHQEEDEETQHDQQELPGVQDAETPLKHEEAQDSEQDGTASQVEEKQQDLAETTTEQDTPPTIQSNVPSSPSSSLVQPSPEQSSKKSPLMSVFDEESDASQIDPWLQTTAVAVQKTNTPTKFLFEDDEEDEEAKKKREAELQKKKKATTSKLFDDLDDDFL
ncbi:hypothetical protein C9374_002171 [Naegleria lovaniensis]|uniref:peptidylprolyl isomerase n=1 Tax=Naegleria lovaniensis TaxID=51637 RepID=A0AA88GRL7_NAELO|nr:uncharacterized protein C9374_002171 [Naegleria lovaniensis]KAG2387136.1 hypothetical protein C9374_002171 [Naegleria lovaniensis]